MQRVCRRRSATVKPERASTGAAAAIPVRHPRLITNEFDQLHQLACGRRFVEGVGKAFYF
jgi:hypothetical protein